MANMTEVAWPIDRRKEIEHLEQLLHKLRGLNRGSRFLENVAECIGSADCLLDSDINSGRQSFMRFLVADACRPKDMAAELRAAQQRISMLEFALGQVLRCETAAINGCGSRSNLSGKNVEARVAEVSKCFETAKRTLKGGVA